jgi:5-methylcytosine-specific restriction endonuclease McrA
MPVTMTKAEVKKLLVDERKKSRTKQQQSKFMSKTLSVYNGQKKRLSEERSDGTKLPYSLAQFRDHVQTALDAGTCPYTGERLTLTNMAADHATSISQGGSWALSNIVICTRSANWQKGLQTREEYIKLMRGAQKVLSKVAFDDFKRRLSMGGKWLNSGGR